MKRTIHTLCDTTKTLSAVVFSLFFFAYGILFSLEKLILGSFVFLFLGIVFGVVSYHNLVFITISEEGIVLRRANGKKSRWTWNECKEVGILGTKAFPKDKSNRGGRKFYYFSSTSLDEQQRFELILQFPSKDVPYLHYKREYFEIIQYYWSKELVFYNTGNLDLTMREL